jgi:tetratricopeptide (TPR) repeat protein
MKKQAIRPRTGAWAFAVAYAATLLAPVRLSLATAERFVPGEPGFLVLELPERSSRAELAALEREAKADPRDARLAERLAARYLDLARSRREPRYFGRAESIAAPWIERHDAPVGLLVAYADALQFRHEFPRAVLVLNRALGRDARHARALLMRASIRIVQGEHHEARSDCGALLGIGESSAAGLCLANVLGATGDLERATRLVDTLLAHAAPLAERVWGLSLAAEFATRRGDDRSAERLLREALALSPGEEPVRTALCDILLSRGDARGALAMLEVERPSAGLLVRRAWAQSLLGSPEAVASAARVEELFALADRRGERTHLREQALFALRLGGDPREALELARANFAVQREAIDVRLLHDAAHVAGEQAALAELAAWVHARRYEDRRLTAVPRAS